MGQATTGSRRLLWRYLTRNWREHDQALISRGDLTVWISPDLVWRGAKDTDRRSRLGIPDTIAAA
ncbi:hypothetical protein [Roseomonas chloroacetimidivorans]|uniref:hypothetical protein n=1 Tax=Roseomonas chloroacetimidivorans TaxID=1766656 RepID=UPI003C7703E2